ncbi:MAG: acetyl ornithine aminotransferase family protein [Thermoplasmata archaeon]
MKKIDRPEVKTEELPGPKAKGIINDNDRNILTTTQDIPVVIKRGRGVAIEDVDGNTFFDFSSGVMVQNVGYSHPRVVKAIKEQAEKFTHFAHSDYYYEVANEFAEKLKNVTKGGKKKVGWSNSGSESNEAAMKLIKNHTDNHRFISFSHAFHGRTQSVLALTASKPEQQMSFHPVLPETEHVPFPNPYRNIWGIDGYEEPEELTNRVLEYLEEMVFPHCPPQDIAGIFIEPIQGEGGYVVPPDRFFKKLRKLADEYNIMIADDEIQMGVGRTGKFWAIENFDVEPDTIQAAKAVGGGVPIGAVIFNEEMDYEELGRHGSTFAGNPIACAAGLEVIDIVKDNLKNAEEMGKYLNKRLSESQGRYDVIGDVRGIGLAQGIEYVKEDSKEPAKHIRDNITREALKKGLLLLGCGESGIRFAPPVNITEEEIDVAVEILDQATKEVV